MPLKQKTFYKNIWEAELRGGLGRFDEEVNEFLFREKLVWDDIVSIHVTQSQHLSKNGQQYVLITQTIVFEKQNPKTEDGQ